MGIHRWSPDGKDPPNSNGRHLELQRPGQCGTNTATHADSAMAGPDGSLSWAIAVVCFVINFLSSSFYRCPGMFFSSIMDTFRVSRGEASVPASVYAGFYCLSALLAGALIQSFGMRLTVIMGGIMMCVGCSVSVYATSTLFLVIAVGVLTGTGHGITNSCCIVAVTRYFDKRRGIALGLNLAGLPVTSLVFPKLLEWLLAEYGLRGTFLLVGACMANVPVLGILLDKPPWEKAALAEAKKPSTGPNSVAGNENESIYHGTGDQDLLPAKRPSTAFSITNHRRTTQASLYPVPEVSERAAASHLASNLNSVFKGETAAPRHRSSIASRRNRVDSTVSAKTLSDASSIASAILPKISGMERRGTMMSVAGSMFAARRFSTCEGDASSRRGTILGERLQPSHCPEDAQQANVQDTTGDAPTSALSSLKQVLSEPRMYFYTLSFFSCTIFVDSFLTVMFDLGEDIGVPISDSVLALTLSSAVEVVGRFFVPFLTDYGLASTISLLTFSYLMLAVISALMPLVSDKIAFVAICATLGLPAGYISVGSSEILSTDMGTKNLPMAYGILLLACAIGGFVRPPVVGFFRDKLGSYNGLFQMLGGMLLLSFIFNVGLWIAGSCSRPKGSKTTSVQDGGNVPISEALSTLGNTEQSTSL